MTQTKQYVCITFHPHKGSYFKVPIGLKSILDWYASQLILITTLKSKIRKA